MMNPIIISPAATTPIKLTPSFGRAVEISVVPGIPGARGKTGAAGSGFVVTAAEPLGGQRIVTASGFHAEPADAALIVGLSTAATAAGSDAPIQNTGIMSEGSWTWTPGAPLFCGVAGVLTHTAPSTGPVRRIGVALSATAILIDLQSIIQQ